MDMFAAVKIAEGFMNAEEFLSFLSGSLANPLAGLSLGGAFLAALLGGLAMNLTPCVLPMVPVNLMIIGKSARRGTLYGIGVALAYGAMGLLSALGGMAFGSIQGNPWFNLAVAAIFVVLALALMGAFAIDFSGARANLSKGVRGKMDGAKGDLLALFMGAVSAVLAGACVAPILIAVLLLTAKLVSEGSVIALALPFALGIGMGLPWPFAGAGLQVLPKPGKWMSKVEKLFGVIVLGFAFWYGHLAYALFAEKRGAGVANAPAAAAEAGGIAWLAATPETFPGLLAGIDKRPVLVDCWATWCKNCRAMERRTLKDPKVLEKLGDFTLVRLQAEDIDELRRLQGFETVKGLPAFAIFTD